MNMKIVEAEGYSKEKALKETEIELDIDMFRNATNSWRKAGSPTSDKALKEFLNSYFKKEKVPGILIAVTPASDDTRQRPYTIVNEVTTGKRKATSVYQVKEAVLKSKTKEVTNEETGESEKEITVDVVSAGLIAGKATKKDAALKVMKDLIRDNRRDYAIEIVKEITEGQKYAAYGLYTPSTNAEIGKFIFAVLD